MIPLSDQPVPGAYAQSIIEKFKAHPDVAHTRSVQDDDGRATMFTLRTGETAVLFETAEGFADVHFAHPGNNAVEALKALDAWLDQ